MRSTVRPVVISIFAAALLAGGVIFWGIAAHRAAGPLNGYARLVIPRGTTLTEAATQLRLAGIIRHPTLFILAARLNGLTIKAGEFDFTNHMTASEVLQRVDDGKTVVRASLCRRASQIVTLLAYSNKRRASKEHSQCSSRRVHCFPIPTIRAPLKILLFRASSI